MTDDEIKPTELPPSIADRLGYLLAKAHLLLIRQVERKVDLEGFSGKHFGSLTVIADEGPLTQQRLGERLGVDRTTIVGIVDALEEKELVRRRRNPEDRRAYALEVTAKGRASLERITAKVLDAEREFLADLSGAERKLLVELLQRLLVSQPAELVSDAPVEVRSR